VARAASTRRLGPVLHRHELATLEALVDRTIPSDPGAKALGAARYIERLLTAFEHPVSRIFAGGPFSGRAPFPDERTGRAPDRTRDGGVMLRRGVRVAPAMTLATAFGSGF